MDHSRTVMNIHDAKTHLSEALERVVAGTEIVIAKAGKPIARIVPFAPKPKKKKYGRLAGTFRVTDDFNAPLPEEVLRRFEGA